MGNQSQFPAGNLNDCLSLVMLKMLLPTVHRMHAYHVHNGFSVYRNHLLTALKPKMHNSAKPKVANRKAKNQLLPKPKPKARP